MVTKEACPHLGPNIRQHSLDSAMSEAGWCLFFLHVPVRWAPQAFMVPRLEALCQIRNYGSRSWNRGFLLGNVDSFPNRSAWIKVSVRLNPG